MKVSEGISAFIILNNTTIIDQVDTLATCCNTWQELLLNFLLYKPTTGLYISDMERLASRCLSYFETHSRFDQLLTSIIRREHYRTLELADDSFPPVFVAHLANVFQHAGIITASTTEYHSPTRN